MTHRASAPVRCRRHDEPACSLPDPFDEARAANAALETVATELDRAGDVDQD